MIDERFQCPRCENNRAYCICDPLPPSTNGDAGHPPAAPRFKSTRLADVDPQRVAWLWSGWLPRGKLVVLDGDPDVGKSTLMNDVAARVSTGRPMPDEDLAWVSASNVVLMAAEDGLADTIRPRLDAAGADTTRIHHLDAVARVGEDGHTRWVPPTIPDDLEALEAMIVATGAVLVIVDVLMAYLSGRADSHRDQDVRRALAQLAEIAARTEACVVLLRHLRKTRGTAMYAGGGSIGIIGVARAGLIAAVDPDDDTGDRRVLAVVKSNLAAKPTALAYRLVADASSDAARVEWLGASAHTADHLTATAGDGGALDEAEGWLSSVLADGPMLKREVVKQARAEGIKETTLKRAGQRLRVISERDDSQQGRPATWSIAGYGSTVTGHHGMTHNLHPAEQGKRSEIDGYGSTFDVDPKPSLTADQECDDCG